MIDLSRVLFNVCLSFFLFLASSSTSPNCRLVPSGRTGYFYCGATDTISSLFPWHMMVMSRIIPCLPSMQHSVFLSTERL